MPSKNSVKQYDIDSYYHVYNRGVEKRKIFLDDQDYSVFLGLLKRHLGRSSDIGSQGREYLCLASGVELISFCLMPNHFHLMLYQIEMESVTQLMRAVCASYVTYFNNKYERVGTLFQGKFKAVRVCNDDYLLHLSRYIHRNPSDYMHWKWSSLGYWIGDKSSSWVRADRVNNMGPQAYIIFIRDDENYKVSLKESSFSVNH